MVGRWGRERERKREREKERERGGGGGGEQDREGGLWCTRQFVCVNGSSLTSDLSDM